MAENALKGVIRQANPETLLQIFAVLPRSYVEVNNFTKNLKEGFPAFTQDTFSETVRHRLQQASDKRATELVQQVLDSLNQQVLTALAQANSLDEFLQQQANLAQHRQLFMRINFQYIRRMAQQTYDDLPETNAIVPDIILDHGWVVGPQQPVNNAPYVVQIAQAPGAPVRQPNELHATAYALKPQKPLNLTRPYGNMQATLTISQHTVGCKVLPPGNNNKQELAATIAALMLANAIQNKPIIISGSDGAFALMVKRELQKQQHALDDDDWRKSLPIKDTTKNSILDKTMRAQSTKITSSQLSQQLRQGISITEIHKTKDPEAPATRRHNP